MANDHRPSTNDDGMANDQPPTPNDDSIANDQRPTANDDAGGNKNFFVNLARYSQLAFVLPACTVVGWLIGVGLDHWLHTTWIYLVGLIAGIAAGFVELIRTVASSEKG
ncbi:MAG TPA: AtpZ/AtpI family protein [Terriglobales bacterium]